MRRALLHLLWLLCSSAILLIGFAAALGGIYLLGLAKGSVHPEKTQMALLILATYFRVVFFKGLLPQLALALALWPLLRRFLPQAERSWTGKAVCLALAAGVAYAAVGRVLLGAESAGWPGLQMPELSQQLGTGALMTGGIVLSCLAASLLVPALRPGADSSG